MNDGCIPYRACPFKFRHFQYSHQISLSRWFNLSSQHLFLVPLLWLHSVLWDGPTCLMHSHESWEQRHVELSQTFYLQEETYMHSTFVVFTPQCCKQEELECIWSVTSRTLLCSLQLPAQPPGASLLLFSSTSVWCSSIQIVHIMRERDAVKYSGSALYLVWNEF